MERLTALGDWPGLTPHRARELYALLAQRGQAARRSSLEEIGDWFDKKPAWAKWFTRSEPVTLLGNAIKTEITAYVILQGCFGVLRFFSNTVGNISDYPNVRFSVEIDGAPLTGFARIEGPFAPSLNAPAPMMDALLPGQRVRVVASNLSASSISNVQAFFRGWYWAAEITGQER